jgi:hypothetical protein
MFSSALPYELGATVALAALQQPAMIASSLQPAAIAGAEFGPFGPYAQGSNAATASYVFANQSPQFLSAVAGPDNAENAFGNLFKSMGTAISNPTAPPGIPSWMVIVGLGVLVFFLVKK